MADLRLAVGYAEEFGAVLIGSLFSASTVDPWVELAKMQEDIGVQLIELDFGCPNVTASAHSDLALDGAELGGQGSRGASISDAGTRGRGEGATRRRRPSPQERRGAPMPTRYRRCVDSAIHIPQSAMRGGGP